MQQFEIMMDGVVQPGEFGTMHEANGVAMSLRQSNPGCTISIRPKIDGDSSRQQEELAAARADRAAKVMLQASSPDGSQSVIFPQGALDPADAHRIAADLSGAPPPVAAHTLRDDDARVLGYRDAAHAVADFYAAAEARRRDAMLVTNAPSQPASPKPVADPAADHGNPPGNAASSEANESAPPAVSETVTAEGAATEKKTESETRKSTAPSAKKK